ncbi:MAG TPA: hypothetical protein VH593_11325 [Ktedonobacteraceae bacterium]
MGNFVWIKAGKGWRSSVTWQHLREVRKMKHAQDERLRDAIKVVVVHIGGVGARFGLFTYLDPSKKG